MSFLPFLYTLKIIYVQQLIYTQRINPQVALDTVTWGVVQGTKEVGRNNILDEWQWYSHNTYLYGKTTVKSQFYGVIFSSYLGVKIPYYYEL